MSIKKPWRNYMKRLRKAISEGQEWLFLFEKIKHKWIKKKGKRTLKWFSTKDGFRVVIKKGKPTEVRISLDQKRTKEISIRKAAKKTAQGQKHKAIKKLNKKTRIGVHTDADDILDN